MPTTHGGKLSLSLPGGSVSSVRLQAFTSKMPESTTPKIKGLKLPPAAISELGREGKTTVYF